MTGLDFLRWILALALAFLLRKLVTKLKLPSILGWLIGGMMLGPHAHSRSCRNSTRAGR